MKTLYESDFNNNYQTHLKHLRIKGLQPKTIEAYSRAIRRVSDYFDHLTRTSYIPNEQMTNIKKAIAHDIPDF